MQILGDFQEDHEEQLDSDAESVLVENIAHAFSQVARPTGVSSSSSSSSSGNQPPKIEATGEPSRIKNTFFLGNTICGRISYLLNWQPISISGACAVHVQCGITGDMDLLSEDDVINWLFEGPAHGTSEEHLRRAPEHANRKRARARGM